MRTALLRSHRAAPVAPLPNGNHTPRAHPTRRFDGFFPPRHEKTGSELSHLHRSGDSARAFCPLRRRLVDDRPAISGYRRRDRGHDERQAVRLQHSRPVSGHGCGRVDRRARQLRENLGKTPSLGASAGSLANEGVGLVFVGDGAQRPQIEEAASGSSNIRFLEFFPPSKISSVLAAADAHVITVKRGLEGVVVPSKMYGILAAGKPIVAVAPNETDAVSLGVQRGFAVAADPDRPAEVASAVHALASDPIKLKAMGEAARAAAPDYDRVKELRKFAEIINRLKVG